jgi:WD40 repeat protein
MKKARFPSHPSAFIPHPSLLSFLRVPSCPSWTIAFLLTSVFCLLTSTAFAVSTSHWTHTTEADFKKGSFHNVVATNLGDLKLSRAVKALLDQDPKVSSVYCLAESPDHTIYAGTGPQGALLQIKDDKVTTVLTLDDDTNILSLLIDKDGRVLIGTGGDEGKILRIDHPGDKPKEIFKAKDVQYIWKMVEIDDHLYAATGPNGQLFDILPEGGNSVLLKSNENNLLSMISDHKDLLYIGTDPNGLVYRVNRKTKEKFVLYDAGESEVAALALDDKGNLYAATAQTEESGMTGAAEEASNEKTGRPESGATAVPIPSKPPENPQPPKLPEPNPGEPAPIPKKISLPTRRTSAHAPITVGGGGGGCWAGRPKE